MPKPFANSQPITPSLISGDWLLGIQTGNSTGDNGLPQMKYIKLSQLTDWVRSNFGEMWRYRGGFSASLPSDPQDGDYFLATATFTVGADTYTEDHLYAYNGSSWDDISDVLTQYASQSQVTDIDDRLTVVEVKVDAMGDGVVYKGEVATYADLTGIVDPQTGWEYFVTADASFYIYNGSSWDQIDNGIVQTITDGDTAHAPSADAVYDALAAEAAARTAADSNLLSAIQFNTKRIENLEQEHGGYVPVQYRGTNAVPTGKAKYALVESIVGKSRAWNQLVENGDFQSVIGWSGNNCTITGVSSNIATVKITEDNVNCRLQHDVDGWILGHKYLLAMYIKTPYTQAVKIGMGNRLVGVVQSGSLTANAWNFVYGIAEAESDNVSAPNIRVFPITSTGTYQVNDEFQVKYVFSCDMTTILSDWSSSDITTANIPLMVQQIPDLLKYDAYGTSIVDTTVEGVKSYKADSTELDTLSLPSSVTLRSAGDVADTDELNVEVFEGVYKRRQTTRVGYVADMGTDLIWTYSSVTEGYYTTLNNPRRANAINTLISNGFTQSPNYTAYSSSASDKCYFKTSNSDELYIKDKNNGLPSLFLAGVSFNYELAEEFVTLLDPIINNTILTEGGGTIETIQTQTPVIDNSLDVGYLAL